jgi:hypothetical protein
MASVRAMEVEALAPRHEETAKAAKSNGGGRCKQESFLMNFL